MPLKFGNAPKNEPVMWADGEPGGPNALGEAQSEGAKRRALAIALMVAPGMIGMMAPGLAGAGGAAGAGAAGAGAAGAGVAANPWLQFAGQAVQAAPALVNMFRGDPYNKIEGNLNEIERLAREGYNPFIAMGEAAEREVYPHYLTMATTPNLYLDALMQGYEESPMAAYKRNQLNMAAHNTAASGGYAGTQGDIMNRTELINELINADMQNYLNNIFNVQGAGLGGLERRTERGFEAGTGLANYLGQNQNLAANYKLYGNAVQRGSSNEGLAALANLIGQGITAYGQTRPPTPAQEATNTYTPLNTLNAPGYNYQNPVPANYITQFGGR